MRSKTMAASSIVASDGGGVSGFDAVRDVTGTYECSQYIGTSGENPWHHVTITPIRRVIQQKKVDGAFITTKESSFRWKNQAGVTWTLYYDGNDDRPPSADNGSSGISRGWLRHLRVGTDCPYYEDGHIRCQVERDSKSSKEGKVVALLGPWGERYVKVNDNNQAKPEAPISSVEISSTTSTTDTSSSDGSGSTTNVAARDAVLYEKAGKIRMKQELLRKRAERLGLRNNEIRKKQEQQDLQDAMKTTAAAAASAKDVAQQVLQMKTFTNHLASIAENIQKISSLKDTLEQRQDSDDNTSTTRKAQLDHMTNQLFDHMYELAKQSPYVGDNSIDKNNDEEDTSTENDEEEDKGMEKEEGKDRKSLREEQEGWEDKGQDEEEQEDWHETEEDSESTEDYGFVEIN